MKNLLLALVSGFLLAMAWPTYGFAFLLFFAFVPLLFATEEIKNSTKDKKGWKVLGLAYISFFIFNIITTNWLYFSTPFGMWFAVLANALLMTLVWRIYFFVRQRLSAIPSLVFLSSLWMLFEWMHLHWEFSWPWLNLGNGFATSTSWIQWYEYTGTFGGSLWIWATNILLFFTINRFFSQENRRPFYYVIACFISLIAVPIIVSQFILNNYSEEEDPEEIVLLQPNIDPYKEKYNITNERIATLLYEDAAKAVDDNTNYLIAPETVLAEGFGTTLNTFDYSREKEKAQLFLKKYPNLNFLTGIQFYNFHKDRKDLLPTSNFLGRDRVGDTVWGDFYNSAVLLNKSDSSQIYHKSKLVVGVENFPYQSTLKPLLGNIMIDLGGTVSMKTKQLDRTVFEGSDHSHVAPVICYESVYGEFVTGYVRNGAQFLAIITNDAWWGETQGHKQHLNYARLRAIENRRSVARSANTGISAFIDQTGKITDQLGYGKRGTLKGTLNKNATLTFYTKYGNFIPKIALIPAFVILLLSFFKKKKALTLR
ncbi:apolipoprotein N-acyltransferase [Flavimarina sp. Hel_I_48]|uniref:apolipoprotein N-acyltransferase n=1 Tax=Flavimarina sp. Hel_I_48 TaxID=1392488 RepID=UPI0004DF3308|nr:apolipoprotein N-acyltransferase [Flavimarina sp. Hel_I_48]